jgi:hypothetical protein
MPSGLLTLALVLAGVLLGTTPLIAQKNISTTSRSELLSLDLPSSANHDARLLSIAAAKSVLEMETKKSNVNILAVEVLAFINPGVQRSEAEEWIAQLKDKVNASGFELSASSDGHYFWATKDKKYFLVYAAATKKQADVYIGETDRIEAPSLPPSQPTEIPPTTQAQPTEPKNPAQPTTSTQQTIPGNTLTAEAAIVGNWGTLSGPRINWYDANTGTIMMSGISKGFGLEFNKDGTYTQVSVITSGYPNYRIWISTLGTWKATANEILFTPTERHYQKWESEVPVTDEHSVPEPYSMIWRAAFNTTTSKRCLYVRYPFETEDREICEE